MSLPLEFTQRIEHQLGAEAKAFLKGITLPPVTSIRTHPLKSSPEFQGNRIPWEPHGLWLNERPIFTLDPYFHAGHYYVQEASSMFLGYVLQSLSLPDEPVILDACAAPGGKSTQILSYLNGRGLLISNEILKNRARISAENLSKWGYLNFISTSCATEELRNIEPQFDAVIADAPCSGEGLFRRDPSAINEWSVENLKMCATRQSDILTDLWPLVKPGGFLIYSTCTFNPGENEAQIQSLLRREDAELRTIEHPFQTQISSPVHGTAAFYPHKTPGEGFFIGVVQKKGTTNSIHEPDSKIESPYFSIPHRILKFRDSELAMTALAQDWLTTYGSDIHVIQSGLYIGNIGPKGFIPHQHLSYSPFYNLDSFPIREVDRTEALKFLKGESLHGNQSRGYHLIKFENAHLGWVKEVGNRANNAYPKELRIRMDI